MVDARSRDATAESGCRRPVERLVKLEGGGCCVDYDAVLAAAGRIDAPCVDFGPCRVWVNLCRLLVVCMFLATAAWDISKRSLKAFPKGCSDSPCRSTLLGCGRHLSE